MARLRKQSDANYDKLTQAFPYQREAIDEVSQLEYSAIFFEQGLGKTKIAIDLALDWLSQDCIDTVIVVTKKGLVRNWIREFQIHSHIVPRVLSSDRLANHRALFSPSQVFVANYEAVALEEEKLRAISNHREIAAILDESQKIKNPASKLTQSFLRLSGCFRRRVIMTGTPMANRPYDIWSQVHFLDGGASLGRDFATFKSKLELPKSGDEKCFLDDLGSVMPRIANFAIRQTKDGSGLELPGKVYKTVEAEWEPLQREMYEKVRNDLRIEIFKDGKRRIDEAEIILKRLLRLLQITSNPLLLDESYANQPGKMRNLRDLVQGIVDKGEKVIIWTSFVENCQYLRKSFGEVGAVQIHGKMAISDRDNSVERFMNSNDVRVLVATPSAAKEGLTLTAANNVIFYDRSFSLDDYLQAQDRIHRISQTKTCFVYNVSMRDSIDQWVDALISLKSSAVQFAMGDRDSSELELMLEVNLDILLKRILEDE